MILDREKISRIKRLLKSRPKGLTISDIAHTLKLNRNSVAKYLEILLIAGEVEVRMYGNAKVYTLAQRVPISSLLRFTTELILILDAYLRVIDVNENFLSFFSARREDVLGSSIMELRIPGLEEISVMIQAGDSSSGKKQELSVEIRGTECTLAYKIVPMVFDDGTRGYTLIFEDVTLPREYERRLRMSEERYRAIVEDQTEFICRFDPEFRLTFVNGALCRYMGWVAGEVLGKDVLGAVHPGDREMVRERVLSLGPGREVETHEQRVVVPSGETRWHQWTNRAILDGSGRIVEYQGVGRDITERRLSEERLRVLDMAVSSSVNGIVIATLDGRISYANAAFLRMIGASCGEEVAGKSIESLFPPGKTGVRLDGATAVLRERGEWNGEVAIPRHDGRTVHALHTANLVRDAAGNPIAMMASFTDISERIEAEREIRIRDAAIESATNAIVIFDPDERLVYANRVFLSLFGARDIRDMQENHMGEFWNLTRYFTPSMEEIRREVSRSGAWNGEIRVNVGDGQSRLFQSSLTLVRDEAGMPASYIGVFMEITAQKAMEKALRTTYEKIQEAAEFMPDPTFILGRDRRVIAWNRALEVLSGVRKEEVLGSDRYREALSFLKGTMPVLVDILGLPAHDLAKNYPSVRKFGDSLYAEATIPGSTGGTERYIWAKASPLFDGEGNIVGAIESFRDISGWKRARESLAVQGFSR